MKVAERCVVCSAADIRKKIGQFAPFISHLVFDYPVILVSMGNGQPQFPTILTNAIC